MQSNGNQTSLSPATVLRTLKRRKWFLLLPVFLLTPAVCYYAMKLPQRFRAHALVGAEPTIPGQAPAVRADASVLGAQEQMRAIRDLLLNPSVIDSVGREFGIPTGPSAGKDSLQSRIKIELEGPDAFDVGFEGPDARQVADVSNRLASIFVERTRALQGQQVEQHDDVLDREVERTQRELNAQEESVKNFREKISQELPERLAANLKELENLQQQIQSKSEQITEAEARRSSIAEEIKALEKQGILQEEPPAKTPAQIELDDLRTKLSQLKARYTPEHPEIVRLEQEIHDLEASAKPAATPAPRQPSAAQMRYIALQSELKSIDPRVAAYQQDREVLTAQAHDLEQRISSAPAVETTLSDRTKDAAMLRTRYEALFAKQQEARLSQRTNPAEGGLAYRVLEPATPPTAPYTPHSSRIILFGLVAALGLGIVGVVAADKLDTTFETGDQVEAVTTLPILSSVPTISQKFTGKRTVPPARWPVHPDSQQLTADRQRAYQKQRVIMMSDPQSVGAQQYGILALKVWRWLGNTGGRTLLVTSAAGEEGKSLTAINLALALSAMQSRVLLVDADMHLPQVAQRLGLKPEKGLSELLEGSDRDLEPYISRVGNLDVICGGRTAENASRLLASQRAGEILAKLRDHYQVVVIDSPPVVPIPDSHILAGLSDGVLLVVRARHTRQELLLRAADSLNGANLTMVLNDVDYAATSYAHAYQYK